MKSNPANFNLTSVLERTGAFLSRTWTRPVPAPAAAPTARPQPKSIGGIRFNGPAWPTVRTGTGGIGLKRGVFLQFGSAVALVAALLAPAPASAAVVFNVTSISFTSLDPGTAQGTGDWSALPVTDGFQGMKAWGSGIFTPNGNTTRSTLAMLVRGSGDGTIDSLTTDPFTISANFTATRSDGGNMVAELRFQTNGATFITDTFFTSGAPATISMTNTFGRLGLPLESWFAELIVGSDGGNERDSLTLTIPQNSLDIFGYDPPSSAPEPATWSLAAIAGAAAIAFRRKLRPGSRT